MTSRDWALSKIREFEGVISAEPVGADFIRIERRDDLLGEAHPSFITGIISSKRVKPETLNHLWTKNHEFEFVANIPSGAIWEGAAIALAESKNIGWGGLGELRSALGQQNVRGFQKKEYSFAIRGLGQHSAVVALIRISDRLLEIRRQDPLPPIRAILLYDYELTADRVREARENYGEFSAIIRTNPNGGATTGAIEVAAHIGVTIFQWGDFLSRLRKP